VFTTAVLGFRQLDSARNRLTHQIRTRAPRPRLSCPETLRFRDSRLPRNVLHSYNFIYPVFKAEHIALMKGEAAGQLNPAITANDLARVEELLTACRGLRQVLIDDVPLHVRAIRPHPDDGASGNRRH
jgi:hypothetical protein